MTDALAVREELGDPLSDWEVVTDVVWVCDNVDDQLDDWVVLEDTVTLGLSVTLGVLDTLDVRVDDCDGDCELVTDVVIVPEDVCVVVCVGVLDDDWL